MTQPRDEFYPTVTPSPASMLSPLDLPFVLANQGPLLLSDTATIESGYTLDPASRGIVSGSYGREARSGNFSSGRKRNELTDTASLVLDTQDSGGSTSQSPSSTEPEPRSAFSYGSSYSSTEGRSTVYSFYPESFNTMVIAPVDSPDHPEYHISFRMNCLLPNSFLTVVRRHDERGEIVADFEMGPPGSIYMRRREWVLEGLILERERTVLPSHKWKWNYKVAPLRWNCGKHPYTCKLDEKGPLLARFNVLEKYRQPGQPETQSRLELLPHGRDYFDDIVVSLLVLERKRLGTAESHKHPFKASDPVPWLWS